jgi:hypothetical protein
MPTWVIREVLKSTISGLKDLTMSPFGMLKTGTSAHQHAFCFAKHNKRLSSMSETILGALHCATLALTG